MKAILYIYPDFSDGVCAVGIHGYRYDDSPLLKGIGKGATYTGPKGYFTANKKDTYTDTVTPVKFIDMALALPTHTTYREWQNAKLSEQTTLTTMFFLDSLKTILSKLNQEDSYTIHLVDLTGIYGQALTHAGSLFESELVTDFHTIANEKNLGVKMAAKQSNIATVVGNNAYRHGLDCPLEISNETDPTGYFSTKTVEKPPMLTNNYLYTESLANQTNQRGESVYCLGKHHRKGANKPSDRDMVGKPDAGYYYAIVATKEPYPVFDRLFEIQKQFSSNKTTGNLISFDIAVTHGSEYFQTLLDNPLSVVSYEPQVDRAINLKTYMGRQLSCEYKTAKLTLNLKDDVQYLNDVLEHYRGDRDSVCLIRDSSVFEIKKFKQLDVTDHFYETDGKKNKLRTHITSATRQVPIDVILPNGRKAKIKLEPATMMPERNALSRLAATNPKLTLLMWMESETLCRYAVVIESDDAIGIFAPIYRNYHLLF